MGSVRLLAALGALALLLAVAPTALAASKSDRAAARSFASAAVELTKGTRAVGLEDLVATQQASLDCHQAAIRRAQAAGAAPSAIVNASLEGLAIARSIIYATAMPSLDRFTKRLDRIRVRDRRLRAGRTAWRAQRKSMRVYTSIPFPLDICERANAWADRGGRGEMFPGLKLGPALREMKRSSEAAERDERIDRAAERIDALGQSRSRARRFTVAVALQRQLDVEEDIVAPYGTSDG